MDVGRERKTYICIDLKSFYASVECVERGLDPFETNLVVADPERTQTTICLAITPAMKALGVKNRCRVYEIPKTIEYITATPRMRRYMEVSAQIYGIYLRFASADDIHVYSVDECFIDATPYLRLYDIDAHGFARMLMDAVYAETGICATAGIGTNLFLAKVALDITAKHTKGNIGYLDEAAFREKIWFHHPITDIWNIGPGIARRLKKYAVYDLAGVCAMEPRTLYREFGKNAEFLIDHAWGQEPCTIAEIHAYRPQGRSISNGQVLASDYSAADAKIVLREMVDANVYDLVKTQTACRRVSLSLGYSKSFFKQLEIIYAQGGEGGAPCDASDIACSSSGAFREIEVFEGEHGKRYIGRGRIEGVPHCVSMTLDHYTNSARVLQDAFEQLFDKVALEGVPIKKINIGFDDLAPETWITPSLFDDQEAFEREHDVAKAVVKARKKFGKNAVLKAASLQEKATQKERNMQVGGHKA